MLKMLNNNVSSANLAGLSLCYEFVSSSCVLLRNHTPGQGELKIHSPVPFVSLEEKGKTRDREPATSLSRDGHQLLIKAL